MLRFGELVESAHPARTKVGAAATTHCITGIEPGIGHLQGVVVLEVVAGALGSAWERLGALPEPRHPMVGET